jgi:uncharacterized protein with FMN-binding domain
LRRAALAVAGLAVGTSLLVAAKAGPQASTANTAAVGPMGGDPSGGPTPKPGAASPMAKGMPTPSAAPTGAMDPGGTAPSPKKSTAKPTPKKSTTKPDDPTDEPVPPPPEENNRFTGTRETNPYGAVQVEIEYVNGKIVDIVAIEMPDSESRSSQLSDLSEPLLRAEALREQGANLDTISGATDTCVSYRDSLRAALDEARG